MQLTTEYREKRTSYKHKDFYLICRVKFSNEELAVAGERGMWDVFVRVRSAEPPPSKMHDFKVRAMRFFGICLLPIGLVSACMTKTGEWTGRTDAPPYWFGFGAAILGIFLFILAMTREATADKMMSSQEITVHYLATDGVFQVHADTLEEAKLLETDIREQLKLMADSLRSSTVIPEQNTYDL